MRILRTMALLHSTVHATEKKLEDTVKDKDGAMSTDTFKAGEGCFAKVHISDILKFSICCDVSESSALLGARVPCLASQADKSIAKRQVCCEYMYIYSRSTQGMPLNGQMCPK